MSTKPNRILLNSYFIFDFLSPNNKRFNIILSYHGIKLDDTYLQQTILNSSKTSCNKQSILNDSHAKNTYRSISTCSHCYT